jgi:hypothetical protein
VGQTTADAAYDAEAAQRRAEIANPTPPEGYRFNENGRMVPIEGSPQQREAVMKSEAREALMTEFLYPILRDVDKSLELAPYFGHWSAPFASLEDEGEVGVVRKGLQQASPAWALEQSLTSLRSSIGIMNLQAIRDASPTGGALGQIPVKQQQMLSEVMGPLKPGMDREYGEKVLQDTKNWAVRGMARAMFGTDSEREAAVQDGRISRQEAAQLEAERVAFLRNNLVGDGSSDYAHWVDDGLPPGMDLGQGRQQADPYEGLSPAARNALERARQQAGGGQ